MLKTLLYVLILAILGFGVWYFLFSEKTGQIFSSSDAGFTVRDTGAIGKIFIAPNNSEQTILLERRGGDSGWIVNRKYPVLTSTLRQLLTTINTQRAAFPVPKGQRDGMIRGLSGAGIKVEIYDRDGRKMRTFYVGGEYTNFAGSVMIIEGSETPYVVQIPGFEGYLTTRYTSDINDWRDRLVFNLQPEQIEQVSIHYPLEPLSDFTLRQSADGKLTVALDSQLNLTTPLNVARTRSYLGFFHRIFSEGYATGTYDLDSIVASMPVKAEIDVRGKGGYHQAVRIVYYPINSRSKNQESTPTNKDEYFNNDHYYAILNGGRDTATVPWQTFSKIMRRGYEFYAPEEQAPMGGGPR